ncbi:hypothetical protein SLA2020_395600 [Shorea laevis]
MAIFYKKGKDIAKKNCWNFLSLSHAFDHWWAHLLDNGEGRGQNKNVIYESFSTQSFLQCDGCFHEFDNQTPRAPSYFHGGEDEWDSRCDIKIFQHQRNYCC